MVTCYHTIYGKRAMRTTAAATSNCETDRIPRRIYHQLVLQ